MSRHSAADAETMSKHGKQHYVPASYLKAWCDPERAATETPFVWVFSVDGGGPRRKSPDNIFHETDMYTAITEDGRRDVELEKRLGQLESDFVRVRNKLIKNKAALGPDERAVVCLFAAAAHARTPTMREHHREQWRRPLEAMKRLSEKIERATPEEKARMARAIPPSAHGDKGTITQEQVQKIVDDPVQTMLLPSIAAEAPLLARLDMAILKTDDPLGFITSDHPCVWFDEDAYRRPPLYRSPALCYKTIEITLPLSPRYCLLLNRQGVTGHQEINGYITDQINRRTRFGADKYFVTQRPEKRDIWFDAGVEPDDSWEKVQARNREPGG